VKLPINTAMILAGQLTCAAFSNHDEVLALIQNEHLAIEN